MPQSVKDNNIIIFKMIGNKNIFLGWLHKSGYTSLYHSNFYLFICLVIVPMSCLGYKNLHISHQHVKHV